MEAIKSIGSGICITIIITAIFSMLVPNNKLNSVLKFAISLFFLASIISPFFNKKLDFHIDLPENSIKNSYEAIEKKADEQFVFLAQENLQNQLTKILSQKNIFPKKINIIVNKSEDGDIFISKIIIKSNDLTPEQKQEIFTVASEQFGKNPEFSE